MANMSNYLENKLIDFLFRSGSYTPPATLYIALCTATPAETDTGSTISEVSGGNYSRQSVSSGASSWYSTQQDTISTSSGSNGTTSNVSSIVWSGATWTATVTAVAICDASTGGNLLFYGALTSSKAVSSGDTVNLFSGDLSIRIDD
jgi:hypothetical protein